MDNLVAHRISCSDSSSRFKQQDDHPYLTGLSQHLDSRFPDIAHLEAFSIFDPVVVEEESPSELM